MTGRADGTIELGELSLAQALQVTIAAPPRVPPKDEHKHGETQHLSLKLHLRQDFALECEAFVAPSSSYPWAQDKALPHPPPSPAQKTNSPTPPSEADDADAEIEVMDTPATPSLYSGASISGAILQICATPSPGKSSPSHSPSIAASTPASSCVRFAASTTADAEVENQSTQDHANRRSSLTRAIARVGSLSASVSSSARNRSRSARGRGHTSSSEGHLTDLYSTPLRRPSTSATAPTSTAAAAAAARLKSSSSSSLIRSPGRPGTATFRPGTGTRSAHSTGSVPRVRPKTARSIRLVGADGSTSPPPPSSSASFPTPTIGQDAQGFSMGSYDPLGARGVCGGGGGGGWSPSLSHMDSPVLGTPVPAGTGGTGAGGGMSVLGDLGARGTLITIEENGLSTPAGLSSRLAIAAAEGGLRRARSVAFSPDPSHSSLSPCSPALGTPLTPLGLLHRERSTERSMRIRGRCQTPGTKRALSLHEELGLDDDGEVEQPGVGEQQEDEMPLPLGFSASVQQVPGHGLSQGLIDLGESLKRLGGGGRNRVFSGGSEGPMIPLPDLPARS